MVGLELLVCLSTGLRCSLKRSLSLLCLLNIKALGRGIDLLSGKKASYFSYFGVRIPFFSNLLAIGFLIFQSFGVSFVT